MTINYTTLLGLAKPVTGTESGVWGDVVNDQITSLLEDAIANAASISVTAGNVTLTDNNGSSDQSRMAILLVTGSPGVSRNIVAPSTSKWYIVKNSSNAEIVLKGSATTGVTIPAGAEAFAFWNGSDFELASMIGPSSSTDNAVARFDGTTGKVVQNSAVTIADTTGDITTGGYVFTAAGAVGTPAYSTSGDTNTGMWFPAADTIAFSEGGAEAMRISDAGNVGIGRSPTFRLDVLGSSTESARFSTSGSINAFYLNDSGTTAGTLYIGTVGNDFRVVTGSNERMRITNGGDVGIGTISPGYKLDVNGAGRFGDLSSKIIVGLNGDSISMNGDLYIQTSTANPLILRTNTTERARITAGGDVGIGTSSPAARLHIAGSGSAIEANTGYGSFNLRSVSTTGQEFHIRPDSGKNGYITFTENAVADRWVIGIENGNGAFLFKTGSATSNTERARITSGGDLSVGKTDSGNVATTGAELGAGGYVIATRNANIPMFVNRKTDDGNLVNFYQDTNLEGAISVSGTTVTYGSFSGSHWSQLVDGSKPEILRGTVLESVNELVEWPNEPISERLCKVKVSDTAGSKKVYGVFLCWDNDWSATNDMLVTSVGAFVCRINGSVTVQEGDLLESNGDGTARVQDDDIMRSSTIGKVTSTVKTHQYDDGSYCVPTVLYCG